MTTSYFRKYDHVERWGHDEVHGLEIGRVYVFPKLDGTNASVWFEPMTDPTTPGECWMRCASRTQPLSAIKDNHGFFEWTTNHRTIGDVARVRPEWVMYGEFLVPHTLKTYREEAWRRFWIFDVFDRSVGAYVPYELYARILTGYGLDVIEPLATVDNPTEEQLRKFVETNTYLIRDGQGPGEGIVVKNYDWKNRYGRQPWAKIVRNEFKEDNRRAFGAPEIRGEVVVEGLIAEKYVTVALVEKTRAKILMETNDLRALIPRLLQTVFYEVVREEAWSFVKEHHLPKIDFKLLKKHCEHWTKKYASDLF